MIKKTLKTGIILTISLPFFLYSCKEENAIDVTPAEPTTDYLVHKNQKAIKINDRIWMSYNLGAPGASLNNKSQPNVTATTDMQGDFYQWGRKLPFAAGNSNITKSEATANGWTDEVVYDINAWSTNPFNTDKVISNIKANNDPCPDGYRIPTSYEINELKENVTISYHKESALNSNKNTIVLTSKNDTNAQLILPAQGVYDIKANFANNSGEFTGLILEGEEASIYSSSVRFTGRENIYGLMSLFARRDNDIDGAFLSYNEKIESGHGLPIRCIAQTALEL